MNLNLTEIESKVRDLIQKPFSPATFPLSLIEIYGAAKSTIAKIKQGSANHAKLSGDILLRNKIFYRQIADGNVADIADAMTSDPIVVKNKPRFIFVTDGQHIHCRDLKVDETLNIEYSHLNERFDFLLPLTGTENHRGVPESPADIKAAGRIAALYDEILVANPSWNVGTHTHELNLFMTRLLFCFFAEDTGIFENHLFSNSVITITKNNVADMAVFLQQLFFVMNTPKTLECLL